MRKGNILDCSLPICIILSLTLFLTTSKVLGQEEQEAISSFEKRVDQFEKWFSAKPKVIFKESATVDPQTRLKSSPTGYIFYYQRFDAYKISYDVRKSDSLISPYMGYITLNYLETNSKRCGDFEFGSQYSKEEADRYFTTLELARQKRDDESCFKPFRVG